MTGFVKSTVGKRLGGDRPSALRALLVAIVVGTAAAVVAYKLMRMQS